MPKQSIIDETLGYITAEDASNTDPRHLIAGSKNVLVDFNRKVGIRNGYTRLGTGNTALTHIRNAFTWLLSTTNGGQGGELPLRFYDDEWEVYLGTVDATVIDAWTRFTSGRSTTATPRGAIFFDTVENIDEMIFVEGTDDLIEWNGAVAIVSSITGTTITKAGTKTFAQNRFYTAANKTVVCVRTGTEYVYTGGETTTTLTGIADTTGLVAGDILVQKIVTTSNKPAADRNNHTIFSFENQICVGSEDDDEVFISQSDDYADFTYSTPRIATEGGLLTLDGPSRGFGSIGSYLLAFAGNSSIFRANYEQITVSTTLAETLRVKRLDTGVNQGAYNPDSIVPVGNALIYLSNEVALRTIENPDNINSIDPRTLSNPIKPDFDAEDWTNAKGIWYKNALWLSAPANSHVYALQFIEDADGKVRRFWQPPQTLPVDPFSVYGGGLYGHSNSVPESYLLFDSDAYSDVAVNGTNGNPDDKIAIDAKASFAYRSYGDRERMKTFDEFYVEGEINQATDALGLNVNYDWDGATQVLEKTIDGSDEDILEGNVGFNSLAQQSLGVNPLGGLLNPPEDARKFRVVFDVPRDDFHEMNASFSTNDTDKYWSIIAHGANASMSPRRNVAIHV